MSDAFVPTVHTRVRQLPQRAAYDRATIYAILDEGLVCHVGFIADDRPWVIPMSYARDHDRLLLHAGLNARVYRVLAGGAPVCVTVTLVDGIVVARLAAHHSMNYRSVVIVGQAQAITEPAAKVAALRALSQGYVPNHGDPALPVSAANAEGTAVLAIPITDASAKTRAGPPANDDAGDPAVWSGELPLRVAQLPPVPHPQRPVGPCPSHLARGVRPGLLPVDGL